MRSAIRVWLGLSLGRGQGSRSGLESGLGLWLWSDFGQKFKNCARSMSKLHSAFCNWISLTDTHANY